LQTAALPGDNKRAIRVHGDHRALLITQGRRIDAKIAADWGTTGIETLRIDPPACEVLVVAGPCHPKTAVDRHCDFGAHLIVQSPGVDPKPPAHRTPIAIVPLRIAPPPAALLVMAGPGHDKAAVDSYGYRGACLLILGRRVAPELAPHRRTRGVVA